MSDDTQGMWLSGGNSGAEVVRIGETVRRPAGFWSASVDALLRHLNAVGCQGVPRTLGFDSLGRHVVEYVEGNVLMPFTPDDPLTAARVARQRQVRTTPPRCTPQALTQSG